MLPSLPSRPPVFHNPSVAAAAAGKVVLPHPHYIVARCINDKCETRVAASGVLFDPIETNEGGVCQSCAMVQSRGGNLCSPTGLTFRESEDEEKRRVDGIHHNGELGGSLIDNPAEVRVQLYTKREYMRSIVAAKKEMRQSAEKKVEHLHPSKIRGVQSHKQLEDMKNAYSCLHRKLRENLSGKLLDAASAASITKDTFQSVWSIMDNSMWIRERQESDSFAAGLSVASHTSNSPSLALHVLCAATAHLARILKAASVSNRKAYRVYTDALRLELQRSKHSIKHPDSDSVTVMSFHAISRLISEYEFCTHGKKTVVKATVANKRRATEAAAVADETVKEEEEESKPIGEFADANGNRKLKRRRMKPSYSAIDMVARAVERAQPLGDDGADEHDGEMMDENTFRTAASEVAHMTSAQLDARVSKLTNNCVVTEELFPVLEKLFLFLLDDSEFQVPTRAGGNVQMLRVKAHIRNKSTYETLKRALVYLVQIKIFLRTVRHKQMRKIEIHAVHAIIMASWHSPVPISWDTMKVHLSMYLENPDAVSVYAVLAEQRRLQSSPAELAKEKKHKTPRHAHFVSNLFAFSCNIGVCVPDWKEITGAYAEHYLQQMGLARMYSTEVADVVTRCYSVYLSHISRFQGEFSHLKAQLGMYMQPASKPVKQEEEADEDEEEEEESAPKSVEAREEEMILSPVAASSSSASLWVDLPAAQGNSPSAVCMWQFSSAAVAIACVRYVTGKEYIPHGLLDRKMSMVKQFKAVHNKQRVRVPVTNGSGDVAKIKAAHFCKISGVSPRDLTACWKLLKTCLGRRG